MYNPVSTYRIQFQKEFSFSDFEKIIPYLQQLGVSTIYASPIFKSTPGSVHGYDVMDPNQVNPEIGNEEEIQKISRQLKENGIGWLQDIVPNHMAFHTGNKWLMDVLEKGKRSSYASFFDISWNVNVHEGRLMVPFLGSSLEEAMEKEEIRLTLDSEGIFLNYFDNKYPVCAASYATLLRQKKNAGVEIKKMLRNISELDTVEEAVAYSKKWEALKQQLLKNGTLQATYRASIDRINADRQLLDQIIKEQFYELCYWQETDAQINFRRFFTINGLICLNIQDPNVFEAYHQLVRRFVEEGIFDGLRVDHIDGLYDPPAYLNRLRDLAGEDCYIVAEKILEPGEDLPYQWDIQGTTGYEFLALVNNLFTSKKNEEIFTAYYRQLTNDRKRIHQYVHEKKSDILLKHMGGELENLLQLFLQLKLAERKDHAALHPDDLKSAIGEFLIQCPVYRYYGNSFPLDQQEAAELQNIFNHIKSASGVDENAIAVLENVFLHQPQKNDEDYNERVSRFYQRCMQFTGPLMAKGVEDTLMYTYNRFIAHNEVGDSPSSFGTSADEFHEAMAERQETWPLAMNATSTHDTKRGEDARARLNVLSDIPDQWTAIVEQWRELTKSFKQNNYPDPNDEYLVYQSLTGAYPMPGEADEGFEERFLAYLQKALREAKRHTVWALPNEAYETAVSSFAKNLLNRNDAFWKSFEPFHAALADHGIINSLAQVLLKFTCPGVPDVYQGCELWDLSFVDPDNRREVDYEKRQRWLNEFPSEQEPSFLKQLWQERHGGKIKLWLTHRLLQWRKEQANFLEQADYLPLKVEGSYSRHVLAFARKRHQNIFIEAVPLHLAELSTRQGVKEWKEIDWKDTAVVLPGNLSGAIENILTGESFEERMELKQLFGAFPMALVKAKQEDQERSAGILAHITSLPSPFGIGDLGQEAKLFAGFLYRSRQRYWQLLPINPTEAGQGHSPYSAISAKAGNTLLISPDLLSKEKLLNADDMQSCYLPAEASADYSKAEEIKKELFDKAYQNFMTGRFEPLQKEFEEFCLKEKQWLDDFALYAVLKTKNEGRPWYEWDVEYKQRIPEALDRLTQTEQEELNKVKWLQFIFFRQWQDLKDYCHQLNIRLIGDMPFYISYDSADVWANKEIFALDEAGARTGMAGVPPDAFSADGQLWGMPVFKWEVLKERGYDWWIDRLKKNRELFDIIRLDHFRAFDAYWEVPAGETTAKNGAWKPGPGNDFFERVKMELGELPFIAEDLGEITESVYRLRDAFHLPGMKVLQFAFGPDMPRSPHIPHHYAPNFIAYTGTHDNNTTVGWYQTEAGEEVKKRLELYLGKASSEAEVSKDLSRLAYSSVARIVILPLQDVLGLDGSSRMNTPSSGENNWSWRLLPGQLSGEAENQLREWTASYDR
jgi:malto-oligosyltrehalose synthase/4-alpha-glucanotransferase